MPRSETSQAIASKREAARVSRRPGPNLTRRLSKRVVQKKDGRYLIYYEKA
jgi:hypothetical protein